jgi:(p)ppGpp synthase/HD superfamily hydrolase
MNKFSNYSLLGDAILFAAHAHAGQTRKYDQKPYINHILEVQCLEI